MHSHNSHSETVKANSFKKRLIVGVVLCNIFIFALAGVFLYQRLVNLEKQTEIKTQNLAQAFENSISECIGKMDISLFAVKTAVEEQLANGEIHAEKLNLLIESYFSFVPQLESIRVADANGEVIYGVGIVKNVNITDRDYFIQHRESADKGLVFAKPVESRMSGKWVLNIARRLNRVDGSFAGIVFGQIAIENFTNTFAKINVGTQGSVALRNAEHEIVARYHEVTFNSEVERKQISSQFKELLESGRDHATFKACYPLDNIERVYTFHRIGEYPLIINVGLATHEYLATWRKEAAIDFMLLLTFAVSSLVFSRALIARWRSEKQVQAELRKSNETLEQKIKERTSQISLVNEQLKTELMERKRGETARLHLELKLQQAQKAESLGLMAGAIAHNFNNMLAAVLGNLELAKDDIPQDTTPFVRLSAAMKAANRAAEVSGLMLTYLGQLTGKHEPLDLSQVCRHSLSMLTDVMPERVNLKADFPDTGPIVMANEQQIGQICTHLVTNAWESLGENDGAIHVAVNVVSQGEISTDHFFPLEWQAQDNLYACLKIADNGCGITDKNIDKLFDPFFTTKFTGRGLGLPVVLGLVRANHGVVTVESQAGIGSIFRIFFPVLADVAAPSPETLDKVT